MDPGWQTAPRGGTAKRPPESSSSEHTSLAGEDEVRHPRCSTSSHASVRRTPVPHGAPPAGHAATSAPPTGDLARRPGGSKTARRRSRG
eukprot:4053742-Alexandrium_andersonii.AAC.1